MQKLSFYQWLAKYGCRKIPPLPGIRWAVGAERQREIMAEISNQIIPARGVRVRVADIPDFPKRSITAELYDIENANQINKIYAEMSVALGKWETRIEADRSPENPLTKQLRARQKIELLKVPIAAELAADYIDKGHSVGIFVNFRATLDELSARFPEASVIHGDQSPLNRDVEIESFQTNHARLILVMSDAGGVGLSLPDLTGINPRGGLVMPSHSAVTMQQIAGRFHRADSLSRCWYRVLLAAGTVEEKIYKNLNQKLANLAALNDADLQPT